MIVDQEEKALVSYLIHLNDPLNSLNYFFRPGLHRQRLAFCESLISGDSSSPAFLIIKDPLTLEQTLVLLNVITGGDTGSGTFLIPQISTLNALIAAADADTIYSTPFTQINTGLQVQTVDLSNFDTYMPP